jgi:hypothetical protein
VFDPDELRGITEIALTADAISRKGTALVPGLVAGGVNLAILQPVFSVLTSGTLSGLGTSASMSAALYRLGKGNAAQTAFWANRVADVAAREVANLPEPSQ